MHNPFERNGDTFSIPEKKEYGSGWNIELPDIAHVEGDGISELPTYDVRNDELDDLPDFAEIDYDDEKDESLESKMTEAEELEKIQDFLDGKVPFDEVKEILAKYYADAVNSNCPWSWGENIPGGDMLTAGQRKKIIECARENGLVPVVKTYEKDGKTYADFSEYMVFECTLEKADWNKTDKEQFAKCNEQLKKAIEDNPELAKKFTPEQLEQISRGETPTGYTWHHSERDGTMQLVPFGVHNSINHCGGRYEGNWADSPRQ